MLRRKGRSAPTGIVIEPHTLARTAIVTLLERELTGWKFIDMTSTASLDRAVGMDIRLVTLNLAGRGVGSSSLRADLAAIAERYPGAPIALLSDTDDIAMATQALQMGIRGFFTTALPIEIALAGLRLVLAGGVFFPHPVGAFADGSALQVVAQDTAQEVRRLRADDLNHADFNHADFTPREADVLAELQCGSSNKVIAGKLNLSGHTVKMHLQHIMRKLQVQNRTEVVARLSGATSPRNGAAIP